MWKSRFLEHRFPVLIGFKLVFMMREPGSSSSPVFQKEREDDAGNQTGL